MGKQARNELSILFASLRQFRGTNADQIDMYLGPQLQFISFSVFSAGQASFMTVYLYRHYDFVLSDDDNDNDNDNDNGNDNNGISMSGQIEDSYERRHITLPLKIIESCMKLWEQSRIERVTWTLPSTTSTSLYISVQGVESVNEDSNYTIPVGQRYDATELSSWDEEYDQKDIKRTIRCTPSQLTSLFEPCIKTGLCTTVRVYTEGSDVGVLFRENDITGRRVMYITDGDNHDENQHTRLVCVEGATIASLLAATFSVSYLHEIVLKQVGQLWKHVSSVDMTLASEFPAKFEWSLLQKGKVQVYVAPTDPQAS
jgi:hypothetical protein